MKTGKNQSRRLDRLRRPDRLRLLVLVPHRDARLPLHTWSAALFAAGLPGAWSFPWLVPLAVLNRPLAAEELKSLARALRRHINGETGKITAGPPALSDLSPAISLFGPSLQIELPADFLAAIEAVNYRISPLVIGSALIPIPHSSFPIPHYPAPPSVSFRAAALANMICRNTNNYLFEWKIGPLHWLPNYKRNIHRLQQ